MALTNDEIQQIVDVLKADSQGIGELETVNSLNGINSLPVISTISGDEKVVQAPIELLSAPAIAAANTANNAASAASLAAIEALSKAEAANSAANEANEKARLAASAAIEAQEASAQIEGFQTEISQEVQTVMLSAPLVNINGLLHNATLYTLSTAIAALTAAEATTGVYRKAGFIISYLTADGWETKQYTGSDITADAEHFLNEDLWESFGSGKGGNVYNVTNTIPLVSGYYTLATAIAATEGKGVNKDGKGIVLTYSVNDSKWESFQFTGTATDNATWNTLSLWKEFGGAGNVKTISVNGGDASSPDSEGNANIIVPIIEVDEALDTASTNPVQNKAIKAALAQMDTCFAAGMDIDTDTNILSLLDGVGNILGTAQLPSGGGGTTATTALTIALTTGSSMILKAGVTAIIGYNFQHINTDDNSSTGETGTVTYKITNGAVVHTIVKQISQGLNSIDVTQYLGVGDNQVTIKVVTNSSGQVKQVGVAVRVVALAFSSSYKLAAFTQKGNVISFPYTVSGSGTKTVVFYIDGVQTESFVVTTSSTSKTYAINTASLSHGKHSLQAKVVMELDNGGTIESKTLYYDLIILETGNNTPVIGCAFEFENGEIVTGNATLNDVKKFESLSIQYVCYTPGASKSTVELYKGDTLFSTVSVDRTLQQWDARFTQVGYTTLSLQSGAVTYPIGITVIEGDIDIEEVSSGLELRLQANGRSNAETNKESWTYGSVNTTFTGFNWSGNGWLNNALHISDGALAVVGFTPMLNDLTGAGKTIDIEYLVSNVHDPDAVIVSCIDADGIGFEVTAQEARMTSSGGNTVSTKFKSGERIRIGFVIKPSADVDESRMMYLYVDGIKSGAVQYAAADSFKQTIAQNITLGNDECDLDVYNIRVYARGLSDSEMLQNYTVDKESVDEMVNIYRNNDVLVAGSTVDTIDTNKLPEDLPVMILTGNVASLVTGNNKKTKIPMNFDYINKQDSTKNFSVVNGLLQLQGTSSLSYPRKNFKTIFNNGLGTSVLTVNGVQQLSPLYAFKDNAFPVDLFCIKADYAESSSTHNTGLARLFDKILKGSNILTPAQQYNTSEYDVRTTVDGFPILVFSRETPEGELTFMGKYNFNNDKGTQKVFGFEDIPGYNEGETSTVECWEFLGNGDLMCLFKESDYTTIDESGDPRWMSAFEGRYPDGNEDYTKLKALTDWIVSTDSTAATNAALPAPITYAGIVYNTDSAAYRLAKFKAEVANHFNMDFLTSYYLLTESFGMVDQRAKNMMFAYFEDKITHVGKWYPIYYDGDTILGVRNDGKLKYSYDINEETYDPELSDYAYAGHNSVLWYNVRSQLQAELITMYKRLRTNTEGLSYQASINMFNVEQSAKWCERIYNLDAKYKYIYPLITGVSVVEGGVPIVKTYNYLESLQGSRKSHRNWWLYNRFNLIDSKYQGGSYTGDYVSFRSSGATLNKVATITAFNKLYFSILWGRQLSESVMVERDGSHSFTCPLELAFGDINYMYGASYMKKVDISNFTNQSSLDVANATNLEELIIGKTTAGWFNSALASLDVKSNIVLRILDISNCTNPVFASIDLSKNVKLQSFLAGGTKITSVNFAQGAPLTLVVLPDTLNAIEYKSLPLLTDAGVTYQGLTNVTRIVIENTPGIDSFALVNNIISIQGNKLAYLRITDVNRSGNGSELINLLSVGGVDDTGANVSTCSLIGTYKLTKYLSDQVLAQLNAHFPQLTIKQPEYTVLEIDESIADGEAISNTDNQTGYKYGNDYVPSGHMSKILNARHRMLGKYTATGTMTVAQLHDANSTFYADAEVATNGTPAVLTGADGDVFMYEPNYWYKGINDILNKKKYNCFSFNTSVPTPAVSVKKTLAQMEQTVAGFGINMAPEYTTLTAAKSASTPNSYCVISVQGYKRVRFPSVNSSIFGAAFIDASGSILSRMKAVSGAGMINGMYLFSDIPQGAVKLVFTIFNTAPFDYVLLTNSMDIEAIEPDWVKHEACLTGVYEAYLLDDKLYSRSGVISSGLVSQADFKNYASLRGVGFQLVDYDMSKDVANLFYAKYGNRDSQGQCGYGTNTNSLVSGLTNTMGMLDTINPNNVTDGAFWKDSNNNLINKQAVNCMGYETWFGNKAEWMDNVYFNTPTANGVWNIGKAGNVRYLQGLNNTGETYPIAIIGGRYMDIVGASVGGSTTTYYYDYQYVSGSTGRVVFRSSSNAYANGGVAYLSPVSDASFTISFIGSRLAFRGVIVWAQSVAAYKALTAIA